MKSTDSDNDFLQRLEKSAQAPLWPAVGAFIAAGFTALFYVNKFGKEGLITIEILLTLLTLLSLLKKRNERRLIAIIRKKIN